MGEVFEFNPPFYSSMNQAPIVMFEWVIENIPWAKFCPIPSVTFFVSGISGIIHFPRGELDFKAVFIINKRGHGFEKNQVKMGDKYDLFQYRNGCLIHIQKF